MTRISIGLALFTSGAAMVLLRRTHRDIVWQFISLVLMGFGIVAFIAGAMNAEGYQ